MTEEITNQEQIPVDPDGEVDSLLDDLVEEPVPDGETADGILFIDRTIDARLQRAAIILQNASGITAIADKLAPYGYDQAKFDEGWALYSEARDLSDRQKDTYAARVGARSRFAFKMRALYSCYQHYLVISRVLFEGDAGVAELFEFDGKRKYRIAGRIAQIRRFFTYAMKEELFPVFTANGVPISAFSDALADVAEVEGLYGVYKNARSLSQKTTLARNEALFVLETWIKLLISFARMALADDEQLLESLMILVRTPRVTSKDRQKNPVFPKPPLDLPPFVIVNP